MTHKILLLKRIACAAGIALLMAGGVKADEVYSTEFTGATQTTSAGGIEFVGLSSPIPTGQVGVEDFFGSNQTSGVGNDVLSLNLATANRYRGTGVWLDTTGWATGPVTVEVDVTSFTAGADSAYFFEAFGATGVDASNTVSLDLHGSVGNGAVLATTGTTSSISSISTQQSITAIGTDVPFTFDFDGTDDFVALTFNLSNTGDATGSVTLDNLTVNTFMAVPEPSSLALLAAGFGLIGVRRRRLT